MRDRFARVFGRAGELERLGSMERGREADFAGFLGVDLEIVGVRSSVEGRRPREDIRL